MPILQLDSAELFYQFDRNDSGEVVTLLNGFTRTSKDFTLLSKSLQSNGFSVLLLDNRGSGKTSSQEEYDLNRMAQDVVELWKYLDIKRSHLIGISMGGIIAQLIACQNSSQINKLILVSTHANPSEKILKGESFNDSREQIENFLSEFVTEVFKKKNKLLFDAMVTQMLYSIKHENFNKLAKEQRKAMLGISTLAFLSKIKNQTLILHGEKDKIVPTFEAKILQKNIVGSNLKILEGYGHLLLAECPRTIEKELLSFLEEP